MHSGIETGAFKRSETGLPVERGVDTDAGGWGSAVRGTRGAGHGSAPEEA